MVLFWSEDSLAGSIVAHPGVNAGSFRAPLRSMEGFSRVLVTQHAEYLNDQGKDDRAAEGRYDMELMTILLVEDNRDEEELTKLAFQTSNVLNQLVVVRDGAEALDYLFCTGPYATRDPDALPALILLDLKLPKIDGLEVLKRLRADDRTKLINYVMWRPRAAGNPPSHTGCRGPLVAISRHSSRTPLQFFVKTSARKSS